MFPPTDCCAALRRTALLAEPDEPGVIVSLCLPWPDLSLGAFLEQARSRPRVYWRSQQPALALAGFGVAATLTAAGPDRFQAIQTQASQLFERVILLGEAPAEAGPKLFGGFAFQDEPILQGAWAAFAPAHFILPRYQLARLHEQTWLTVNRRLGPQDNPLAVEWLLRQDVQQLQVACRRRPGNGVIHLPRAGRSPAATVESLMSLSAWRRWVTEATQRIGRGELDKVVLASASRLRAAGPISPVHVLAALSRRYPDCHRFLFEPAPGRAFYGATPELLAQVQGQALHTIALAGSTGRGDTPAEDAALGESLLANPKERHEHALVVQAIEASLRPLLADVTLPQQPELRRLANIQHLQTPLQGRLAWPSGILPVVEALHPTPAVAGLPQERALRLIAAAEPLSRGWYAAPIGWIDSRGDGIFAVAIRSAVSAGTEAILYAGAGIVADSAPDREWQETQLKFQPLLQAIGSAESAALRQVGRWRSLAPVAASAHLSGDSSQDRMGVAR